MKLKLLSYAKSDSVDYDLGKLFMTFMLFKMHRSVKADIQVTM